MDLSDYGMLIIGGKHIDTLGTEQSLVLHGSVYHMLFSRIIDVLHCDTSTTLEISNYIRSMERLQFKVILLIYVGHGLGCTEKYPLACPGVGSADLVKLPPIKNSNGDLVKFRVIMDCCNRPPQPLFLRPTPDVESSLFEINQKLRKFLLLDFQHIEIRRGLYNYTKGANATLLNSALLEAILNIEFSNLPEFLTAANAVLVQQYQLFKPPERFNLRKLLTSDTDYTYKSINRLPRASTEWISLRNDYGLDLEDSIEYLESDEPSLFPDSVPVSM